MGVQLGFWSRVWGVATEGKPKTFEKNVRLFFFFQFLTARIKFLPQSQELKMKNPTKEKRKEVPDGNLETIEKRGRGKKKKDTSMGLQQDVPSPEESFE